MAIDISLEVSSTGSDVVGFALSPVQARDLAYELEAGAKEYMKTDNGKFYIAFACSFFSCSQPVIM